MGGKTLVIVKLREAASLKDGCARVRKLAGDEAASVEAVFPGDEEQRLFAVTLRDASSAPDVLDALEGQVDVEYAHTTPERRPAR